MTVPQEPGQAGKPKQSRGAKSYIEHPEGKVSANTVLMRPRDIAKALGGEIAGQDQVVAPGPGHARRDRSLSVLIRGEHLVVHSFAGDDWRVCKDYVRSRLGWPAFSSTRRRP